MNFFNNSGYSSYAAPQFQTPYQPINLGSISRVPQYAPNFQTSSMLAAVPLQSSCRTCTGTAIAHLSNATVQVPVHINMNSSMPGPSATGHATFRHPFENELLADPTAPAGQRTLARKKRAGEKRHRTNVPNLTTLYLERRDNRLQLSSASKLKQERSQKSLKRLNKRTSQRIWKHDVISTFPERETARQSRLDMLRAKGYKAPRKTECPLWNCQRKQFKNKRPFMPLGSPARSVSRLSNLSKKSRSPINFHRSP